LNVEFFRRIGQAYMLGVSASEKALCLICSESIAVLGEYNIARYYNFEMQSRVQKLCHCLEKIKNCGFKRG
jgi:hypothetical protein